MQDLNDLYVFSQVVEHNGFTGAAKALGVARSSICRRVSALEERLGVRLVQRTTRHFAVTDIGMEFHGYCVRMVAEAKAAYERVACARGAPSGMAAMTLLQSSTQASQMAMPGPATRAFTSCCVLPQKEQRRVGSSVFASDMVAISVKVALTDFLP